MIELDFLVTPELQVGVERTLVDVRIAASPIVFPDHDDFVTVQLWSHDKRPAMLAELSRVGRQPHNIEEALQQLGASTGKILDREAMRIRRAIQNV